MLRSTSKQTRRDFVHLLHSSKKWLKQVWSYFLQYSGNRNAGKGISHPDVICSWQAKLVFSVADKAEKWKETPCYCDVDRGDAQNNNNLPGSHKKAKMKIRTLSLGGRPWRSPWGRLISSVLKMKGKWWSFPMKSHLQPVHKHELLINYLMKSRKPLHTLSSTAQTYYSLVPNKIKRTHWGCKLSYLEVENARIKVSWGHKYWQRNNPKAPAGRFQHQGLVVHTRASCYCSSHFPVLPGNLFSAAECLISFQEPECSVEGVKIFFTLYTELCSVLLGGCLGQSEELWPLVAAPTHRAGPVVAVLLICSCVNNFLTLVLPSSSSQLAAQDPWCRVKGFGSSPRRCPEQLLAGCSCLLPITRSQHLILVAFLGQDGHKGCSHTNQGRMPPQVSHCKVGKG